MVDPAGALSACSGEVDRPAKGRIRHPDRRMAARPPQAVGQRSVVARAAPGPGPLQRWPGDRAHQRAYERLPQSWLLALERPDGAGLARPMVSDLAAWSGAGR